MDLVSCVIPTYKRSDMLCRAIDSVLNQTYSNVEALVVDDNEPGSRESIAAQNIVKKYNIDNVRYIGQSKHINGAVARNEGIKQARGRYIAFLDDDDEWTTEKIERQLPYLQMHEDIDGVTCLYKIYCNGEEIRRCPPYTSERLQFKVLARQISMYTSTFMCKRDKLLESGGFNESLVRNQDLQMFSDFLDCGVIYPIERYMVILHEDSDMNRKGIQKTIDAKMKFFEVEKRIISKYNIKDRKRIYNAHYFDIVINALRAREITVALKYLLKIGISIHSYKDILTRISTKKEGKRLARNTV